MNRIRSAGLASIDGATADVKKIDRNLDRLLDVILRGSAADRLNTKMLEIEARKRELEQLLTAAKSRSRCYIQKRSVTTGVMSPASTTC